MSNFELVSLQKIKNCIFIAIFFFLKIHHIYELANIRSKGYGLKLYNINAFCNLQHSVTPRKKQELHRNHTRTSYKLHNNFIWTTKELHLVQTKTLCEPHKNFIWTYKNFIRTTQERNLEHMYNNFVWTICTRT